MLAALVPAPLVIDSDRSGYVLGESCLGEDAGLLGAARLALDEARKL